MIVKPQLPAQRVPPLDDRGGDASLPPLLARVWWLFFDSVVSALGVLSEAVLGWSSLNHVGVIPKITGAGTLGESAITDNGTLVKSTERVLIDTGATPTDGQLFLQANALGGFTVLCYASGNINLGFDMQWTGAAWIAKNAGVANILKNGTKLIFLGSTGNVVGAGAALGALAAIDINSGFFGCGGNIAPGYAVDGTGDVNASGVFRVAGTQVVGARLAAIAAPTITTSNTASTAGGTYTATEQAMLNALKTGLAAANTDITNLQATVNSLRDALRTGTGHGLTA